MTPDDEYLERVSRQAERLQTEPGRMAEVMTAGIQMIERAVAPWIEAGLEQVPVIAYQKAIEQVAHRPGCPGIDELEAIETTYRPSLLIVGCLICSARVVILYDGSRWHDRTEEARQRRWARERALGADQPPATRSRGAPAGTGVTFDKEVDAAIELREPDGTWPTRKAVAIKLERSLARLKQVDGPRGGWDAVVEEAARRSG